VRKPPTCVCPALFSVFHRVRCITMGAGGRAAGQTQQSPGGGGGQTKRLAYDGCEVYKLFPAFVGVDAHFLPASRLSALVRNRRR